jgi:SAM-dependent methyltransferase
VVAAAERMPFAAAVFDVVLFIVSLQFVDDMRQAVTEAGRVLKPGGLLIVMLLNPESSFFRRKQTEHGSYIRKIRHTDLHELEAAVNTQVNAQAEYFLGIDKARIFPSRAPGQAALYVLHGRKERRADRTASDDNRRTSPLS